MRESLQFSYEDPRSLKKNSWNPNEVSAEGMMKLKKSIEKNGHIKPILVRELEDGTKEIVGGEHRVDVSIELGHETVPVINLGKISDELAKKALLLDNSRYGEDEVGKLSSLLEDLGEDSAELASYLTYTEDDLATLMSSDLEAELKGLDELDDLTYIDEEDSEEVASPVRELRTHQTMKFKVDVENAEMVSETIDRIIREQGIEDSDAMVRSGEALTWLVRRYRDETIGTFAYVEDEEETHPAAELSIGDDVLTEEELAELDRL
ncbi:ParB/RepB/Spo0J family partition protein [Vibrio fluvialis]|nr:ParB/RepB/Spo0J family partition protein [Vibrio fluvialis]